MEEGSSWPTRRTFRKGSMPAEVGAGLRDTTGYTAKSTTAPSRHCQSDPPHKTFLGVLRLGQRKPGVPVRRSRASGSSLATPVLC